MSTTPNLGLQLIQASTTLGESDDLINANFTQLDAVYQALVNQLQAPDAGTLGGATLAQVRDLGQMTGNLPIAQVSGFDGAWDAKLAAALDTAPATLDTLLEIVAEVQNNESAVAAINTALATKAPLTSPAFTGSPTAPTQSAGDNSTKIATTAFVQTALGDVAMDGFFYKPDHESVAFTKTGNGTASLKAGTKLWVDNQVWNFDTAEPITMPTLVAGTDLYVWLHPDGTVEATTSPTTPPAANARKIGGFHYAPGGMATGFNTGGNTTPQIIDTTFWDLKWRSKCGDPRGMNYWAPAANARTGGFWLDMYLLGVNHHVDGTSAYNVTIADGSSPPKIPLMFGGDGSATYGGFTKFEAIEVFASHGKQLMSYDEFMVAAFGTDEAASAGTDPVSTILRAAYTSRHMFLASGNMWIRGRDFGGPDSGASWNTSTEGRGSVYNQPNAALFGGDWGNAALSGSRASGWHNAPWYSHATVGARGRSDHLCLL